MNKPTLLGNLTIAVLISLMALVTLLILQTLFSGYTALIVTLALMTLEYLGYLLYASKVRSGKITLALLSVILIAIILLLNPNLSVIIACLVSTIWLSRSLLFYRSVLPSVIDIGLCLISVSAAFAAFILSGSIIAGIWCFLLTQALFVFIPLKLSKYREAINNPATEQFNKAYQSAESAIRALANKTTLT
jgi:hypothetical protein